jgi:hypothetical protein
MAGKENCMRTIKLFLAFLILAIPATLFGQIGIRVTVGPPMLPVYEQPLCPGEGYLWTPGYWAYNPEVSDYFWVPGTWVMAPRVGFLWTPGYWGYREGGYYFNEGYWGEHVGFYGGVHYGYGYYGEGYRGGRWDHDRFMYNRLENRLDEARFHNVYEERVEHGTEIRVSFNGGNGGIEARENREEEAARTERHIDAVAEQRDHVRMARENPELRASSNHGQPKIMATSKAGEFGPHAVPPVHPNELSAVARPAPVNSGNPTKDKQYERKQEQLIARQTQERQALQQRQDAEHQRKSNADAQTLEQAHQRQTEQMAHKHEAQQQKLQTRQPKPKPEKQNHPNEKP